MASAFTVIMLLLPVGTSCHADCLSVVQVVDEMHEFNTDRRRGRLMMLCLSPYVNCGDAMTSFGMAELILQEYVPEAVCIVIHGGGVNALYNPENGPGGASSSSDYSTGRGERIFNRMACADDVGHGRQEPSTSGVTPISAHRWPSRPALQSRNLMSATA